MRYMSDTDAPSNTEPTAVDDDTVASTPPVKTPSTKRRPSPRGQAVSGNDTDTVSAALIVFKNRAARKSLSVHHMQRRLAELGYPDAHTDKDGWYGDLTRKAVAEYQRDHGLDGDGLADVITLEHLFADDPNVVLG